MTQIAHLLALVGLAPAVAAETLECLAQRNVVVTGVTLVTTARAVEGLRKALAEPSGGFDLSDAGVAAPSLTIRVISAADGTPIFDIHSAEDHIATLAFLDQVVRELTAAGQPPLHASIAGGRKTMSAALSLVMALRARPQDAMSHVLLEDAPTTDRPPRAFLVDAPFVRLRGLAPEAPLGASIVDLMALTQKRIDAASPARLTLFGRTLRIDDLTLVLPPVAAALLAALCGAAEGLGPRALDVPALLASYRRAGANEPAVNRLGQLLSADGEAWLREHVSRLRRVLKANPGLGVTIERVGRRPYSRYRLAGRSVVLEQT